MSSPDITKKHNLTTRALDVVFGPRENDYDHPVRDFIGTALHWTSWLRRKLRPGCVITPLDVPMMMVLVKSSRESHKHKEDNTDDMVGYEITHERVLKYLEHHNLDPNELMDILNQVQIDIEMESQ